MHEECTGKKWKVGTENGVRSLTHSLSLSLSHTHLVPNSRFVVCWRHRFLEALQRRIQQLFPLLFLGRHLRGVLGLHGLQLGVVVVADGDEGDAVADEVDGGDPVHDDGPREGDQQPVLHHASDVHRESRGLPDQEEHGDVEQERDHGVQAERHEIDLVGRHGQQLRILDEVPGQGQEEEARRGDVVQRGDGVEGDSSRVEQNLNQHQAQGFDAHGRELQSDAPEVEPGFAVGGDGHPDGDHDHVTHGLRAELVLLEGHAQGVDRHRNERLEHLDEGDAEVDIRGVGEPQRQRKEQPDGHYGPQVELLRHRRRRLHNLEHAHQKERQAGRERHVNHGERHRVWPVVHLAVEDVFVEDDHGEAEEDPYANIRVTQDHLLQQLVAGAARGARPALRHGFDLGFAASRLARCVPRGSRCETTRLQPIAAMPCPLCTSTTRTSKTRGHSLRFPPLLPADCQDAHQTATM
jgi:hypothetical protein